MTDGESLTERILHHLGWRSSGDQHAAAARLLDHQRRLRVLEARIAVKERADREAIAELDRLTNEENARGRGRDG
jgi:hypothetical protein